MADLPVPTANRLPRPRWLDTRLIVGVLLILVSVVVGAKVFAEADERVRVWAVTRDLGPNVALSPGDVVVRAVRLDETAGRYVSADQPPEGLVLNRPVGRNELLPVAAVADRASADHRRVVIEADAFSATGLDRGAIVDVYAVKTAKSGEPPASPELVLPAVTVAEDVKPGGRSFGGGGSKIGVTLFAPRREVATLIAAMAHGTVYLVEVPAGRQRNGGAS